jgi:hypothetical protein
LKQVERNDSPIGTREQIQHKRTLPEENVTVKNDVR